MKNLLIGDNAFIGVSHLSQARARERVEKLNPEGIVGVIDKAVSCGASGFTFSTHPTNLLILKTLRDGGRSQRKLSLYPVLPYAEGYVRIANDKGMSGLVREVLSRLPLSGKAKLMIEGGISAITFDPVRMLKAYVDMELGSYLNIKPTNADLHAVLLHEVITDLGLSFDAAHLFDSFMQHIWENYDAQPGFVTRNFVRFVDFFRDKGLPLKDVAIMAPFNKSGFQMNPTRESCETCLSKLTEGNVIAISILAGGYLGLDEATEYLRTLPQLSSVAVGVSSEEHAEQTFSKLRPLLET